MNKRRGLQDLLFALLVLAILFFVELPFLHVILTGGLVLAYSALQQGISAELGFVRPAHIGLMLATALLIAAALVIGSSFLAPTLESLTGQPLRLGPFSQLANNPGLLLRSLALGWVIGAFMEEIIFRAFLLSVIVNALPGKAGAVAGIVISACIFGYLHDYQGITGQWLTGIFGALLAAIYLLNQRQIWLNILIHGLVNTISMLSLYAGIL